MKISSLKAMQLISLCGILSFVNCHASAKDWKKSSQSALERFQGASANKHMFFLVKDSLTTATSGRSAKENTAANQKDLDGFYCFAHP